MKVMIPRPMQWEAEENTAVWSNNFFMDSSCSQHCASGLCENYIVLKTLYVMFQDFQFVIKVNERLSSLVVPVLLDTCLSKQRFKHLLNL